jgi:hypothetical protein
MEMHEVRPPASPAVRALQLPARPPPASYHLRVPPGLLQADTEARCPRHVIPTHLLRVLQCNPVAMPAGTVVLACHAAMLETGFVPAACSAGSSAAAQAVLPSHAVSASVLRVDYQLAAAGAEGSSSAPDCSVLASCLGPSVVFAASTPGGHVRHLVVDTTPVGASNEAPAPLSQASGSEEGGGAVGRVSLLGGRTVLVGAFAVAEVAWLKTLWAQLKDGLALPMLLAIHAERGLPPPAGLLALPQDCKALILSSVQVGSGGAAGHAALPSRPSRWIQAGGDCSVTDAWGHIMHAGCRPWTWSPWDPHAASCTTCPCKTSCGRRCLRTTSRPRLAWQSTCLWQHGRA